MEFDVNFKGVWIPREVWLDERLSAIEKILLVEIDGLDNENHCLAGNEYFAKFCQFSESTIKRSIKKLIELGFISIIKFDGRRRILSSNFHFRQVKKSNQIDQNDWSDRSKRTTNNIYNKKYSNKYRSKEKYKKESESNEEKISSQKSDVLEVFF